MKYNSVLIKGKKKSILSLFGFAQSSIFRSMTSWVLFSLSLTSFIAVELCSIFLVKNHDEIEFKNNLEYVILIYINIFLFLFILTNVIRLFAEQLTNGMFLLLISKPYSRTTIFFSKMLSLSFTLCLFIGFNLGSVLLTGYLINILTNHKWFFEILRKTIISLAIYSALFVTLLVSVTIFLSLVFSPQSVFLVLVIFSSMFLLGGLVHTVFIKTIDPIELRLNGHKSTPSVKSIKQRMVFKDKLKTKNLKYINFTQKIYNFYNSKSLSDIYRIDNDATLKAEKLNLFEEMGLYKTHKQIVENGTINKWGDDHSLEGKKITFTLDFAKFFKNKSELENNNLYHKEIKMMVNEYKGINIKNYMKYHLDKSCDLLVFNESETSADVSFESGGLYKTLKHTDGDTSHFAFNISKILDSEKAKIKFNPEFTEKLEQVFYNLIYFAVKDAEDNIKAKVKEIKLLEEHGFDLNHKSYIRYNNVMVLYQIISYINLIEHWSQLWTSLQAQEKYWFEVDNLSYLNLEKHHNQLLSYKTFPLQFQKNGKLKLTIDESDYILNYKYSLYAYGGISLFLFLTSIIIILRKDIV